VPTSCITRRGDTRIRAVPDQLTEDWPTITEGAAGRTQGQCP
jgi:hypothetical protein